jgi:hypothetical protein
MRAAELRWSSAARKTRLAYAAIAVAWALAKTVSSGRGVYRPDDQAADEDLLRVVRQLLAAQQKSNDLQRVGNERLAPRPLTRLAELSQVAALVIALAALSVGLLSVFGLGRGHAEDHRQRPHCVSWPERRTARPRQDIVGPGEHDQPPRSTLQKEEGGP